MYMPVPPYLTNTKFQKDGKTTRKEETNKPDKYTTLELTDYSSEEKRE